jgi:hypothetical protein
VAQVAPYAEQSKPGEAPRPVDPTAPTLTIKSKDGKDAGKVWLQETDAGIEIIGVIDGPAPNYSKSDADMSFQSHVDVWLSSLDELPTFDALTDWTEKNCEDTFVGPNRRAFCEEKESREIHYPEELARLFVRRWSFAPGDGSRKLRIGRVFEWALLHRAGKKDAVHGAGHYETEGRCEDGSLATNRASRYRYLGSTFRQPEHSRFRRSASQ